MSLKEDLLKCLIHAFIYGGIKDGNNFNGINAESIRKSLGCDTETFKKVLIEAIDQQLIDVRTSKLSINPYVKLSGDVPIGFQRMEVNNRKLAELWLYPTPRSVDEKIVDDLPPYTVQLARGRSISEIYYFDPKVLDHYTEQSEKFELFRGYIYVRNEYYEKLSQQEADSCWGTVRHYSFRQLTSGDEVVCMALCYLGELIGEEQNHWNSYEKLTASLDFVPDDPERDPRFNRWLHATILGETV